MLGKEHKVIEIENINHRPVKLKAFDLQDGSEGIYVENSFRADVSREVVDDIVGDINIAGVPQVSGIQKVFRKNQRTVKFSPCPPSFARWHASPGLSCQIVQ